MKKIITHWFFLLCLQNSLAQNNICFTPAAFSPLNGTGINIRSAVADFNGDGYNDVATIAVTSNSVLLYLSNGSGGFLPVSTHTCQTFSLTDIVTADFNGDSDYDLAVTSKYNHSIVILEGNGDGTFNDQGMYATGAEPCSLVTADFNNDTKPDLATCNFYGNSISVITNTGGLVFMPTISFSVPAWPAKLVAGNFNNDAFPDLAVSNGGLVSLFKGSATGTFSPNGNLGPVLGEMVTADFNSDGKTDLAGLSGNGVTVLMRTANFTFAAPVSHTINSPRCITAGDVNNDNRPDLVTGNWNDISLLPNTGNGTFGTAITHTVPGHTWPQAFFVSVADLTNDNKPELLVGTDNSGDIAVFQNCNTVGIESLQEQAGMHVYPTPANNVLVVEPGSNEAVSLILYSLSGAKLRELQSNDGTILLDTSALDNGYYLLQVKQGNTLVNKSVVIVH